MTRKIISLTGSRSDYWRMRPIFQKIKENHDLTLDLIITGFHLLPSGQGELRNIIKDNFGNFHRVPMFANQSDADEGGEMVTSLGRIITQLPAILHKIKPEVVLLQGDRVEILALAIAASIMNFPIVHMSGGDYSGTIDDSIRNAISKLTHVHLTTCSASTERLLKMEEDPKRIFEVGEPGLDVIRRMHFLSVKELEKELGIDLSQRFILATQHPVTTEVDQAGWQTEQIIKPLLELKIQTIFTPPNTDAGSQKILKILEKYTRHKFIKTVPSLGAKKYLSLMKLASVVVGNSSSGILEAPSFQVPVVNIGTRQYGRLQANNVINVGYNKTEIKKVIMFSLHNKKFRAQLKFCQNPYGDGHTAEKTIKILEELKINKILLEKWIL